MHNITSDRTSFYLEDNFYSVEIFVIIIAFLILIENGNATNVIICSNNVNILILPCF